jgi:hypothetical protein
VPTDKKIDLQDGLEQADTKLNNDDANKENSDLLGGTVEVHDGLDQDDIQYENKARYFKLIYNDKIQGRYCGKKPQQAANKAFSSIVKKMKKHGDEISELIDMDINFAIRECTRNRKKHKEYTYVGVRKTLKEPVKVVINNGDGSVKEIIYKFHNKVKKL